MSQTMPRPPLVLLAIDQEWSARSLESILGPHGYAVLRAYTGQQVLELARTAQPDLVVLDLRLPDMSGIEVCRLLRHEVRLSEATPVIVTSSGATEREQRLAAYRAGAWEFTSQPIDGEVLLLKLDAFMRGKQEADALRAESLLDPVTGLYNMRGVVRRAREIAAEAQRLHAALACVAFSPVLEGIPVAERQRPVVEDRAVEWLGSVIRRAGRISDAIGRLGPAEFAIIAPATDGPGAVRMMERFQRLAEAESLSMDDVRVPVRIHAGYAAVADFAESTVDAVELLLRATTALRYARSGRPDPKWIAAFEDVPVNSEP